MPVQTRSAKLLSLKRGSIVQEHNYQGRKKRYGTGTSHPEQFRFFGKFPAELRLMVWDQALWHEAESRFVFLYGSSISILPTSKLRSLIMPTCREARARGLRLFSIKVDVYEMIGNFPAHELGYQSHRRLAVFNGVGRPISPAKLKEAGCLYLSPMCDRFTLNIDKYLWADRKWRPWHCTVGPWTTLRSSCRWPPDYTIQKLGRKCITPALSPDQCAEVKIVVRLTLPSDDCHPFGGSCDKSSGYWHLDDVRYAALLSGTLDPNMSTDSFGKDGPHRDDLQWFPQYFRNATLRLLVNVERAPNYDAWFDLLDELATKNADAWLRKQECLAWFPDRGYVNYMEVLEERPAVGDSDTSSRSNSEQGVNILP